MILIFRKVSDVAYAPRMAGEAREELVTLLAGMTRVNRDAIVEFFLPTSRGKSEFAKLPALLPQEVSLVWHPDRVDPKIWAEVAAKGWEIPTSDLGRTGRADAGTAQSILLWIKNRLMVAGQESGVTLLDGSDISVLSVD